MSTLLEQLQETSVHVRTFPSIATPRPTGGSVRLHHSGPSDLQLRGLATAAQCQQAVKKFEVTAQNKKLKLLGGELQPPRFEQPAGFHQRDLDRILQHRTSAGNKARGPFIRNVQSGISLVHGKSNEELARMQQNKSLSV
eukprot:gnl/Spiro4/8454_TR4434_c0_g14_i1.p3 gnl/Spiro4/8454_TR4434_c0_g14~~gnl/Spiro4/8454_TR4434_c0_g14_i1.p3  ORF type:complete len:140 (-),score=42.08 gnl/Spiro4/8454_TR4434_c0_g14_i1:62-481(-)